LAQKILKSVQADVSKRSVKPRIAAIIVGDDTCAIRDVERKMRACKQVGIELKPIKLPKKISQRNLHAHIEELNKDRNIHGISVELPLPAGLNPVQVSSQISVDKDIDGFHPFNIGGLAMGFGTFVSSPVQAIITLIATEIDIPWLEGKKVVICGRNDHICKPLQMWLQSPAVNNGGRPGANATVTLVHEFTQTEALFRELSEADMVITSSGTNQQWLNGDMIKQGAVVIDAGFNRCHTTNQAFGDVDAQSCMGVAGMVTSMPGGVGPLITAEFCKNALKASALSEEKDERDRFSEKTMKAYRF